jgi:antitoxin FitA
MSRMIQVRNVPEPLHRTLKSRAALAGMSLSNYVISELREACRRPALADLCARLHRGTPVRIRPAAARLVRAERDSH